MAFAARAADLGPEEERVKKDPPKSVRVLSVEKWGTEDVYDLSVFPYHNFAVEGGLIVHNCMDACRYLIKTLTNRARLDRLTELKGE